MSYWLNVDPIGLAGGINLYVYVGNNPIGRIDPYGLAWQVSFSFGVLYGSFLLPADDGLHGYNVAVVFTTDGQVIFQKQTVSAKDGAGAFIGDGGSISFGQSSGRVKKGVSHECAKHIEGAAALLDVGAGVSIDTGGDPADGSIGGFPGPRIKYTGGLGVIGAIGQSNTTNYAPW